MESICPYCGCEGCVCELLDINGAVVWEGEGSREKRIEEEKEATCDK